MRLLSGIDKYLGRVRYDLTSFVTQTWTQIIRCTFKIQVKYNLVPAPNNKAHEGTDEYKHPILTSAMDDDGCSASSITAGKVARFGPRIFMNALYIKQSLPPACNRTTKVACGAFSALQHVGRLYPCPNEFPSFISRGATHHISTRDLC